MIPSPSGITLRDSEAIQGSAEKLANGHQVNDIYNSVNGKDLLMLFQKEVEQPEVEQQEVEQQEMEKSSSAFSI